MSLIPHTGCPSDKEPIRKGRRTGLNTAVVWCQEKQLVALYDSPGTIWLAHRVILDENQFACLMEDGGQRRLGERWPQKPGQLPGPWALGPCCPT